MQKAKRLLSIVLTVLMCVSMLTGIILPASAGTETPTNNAYADAEAHATELTVTDGAVTPVEGVTLQVPAEFAEEKIYLPDSKLYLYNPSWRTAAKAGVSNEGDYFFAQYGDGTTWGNGKVYLVQWAVNAFGGEWMDANSDPKNLVVLQEKIIATAPTAGGDNNHYVLLFPGKFGSGTTKKEGALPAGVTDPTAADLNTIHFLGPQAGVSPVGEDPTAGVANGRSLDLTKEISFQSYIYNVKNVVMHFDGIAMNSWGSFRRFEPWQGNANAVLNTGLYIDNLYADQDQNDTLFFLGWYETWGTEEDPENAYAGHNAVTTVISIKNSYAKRSVAADGANPWNFEAADLKIEGCVFDGIGPAAANTKEGEFAIDAPNKKMTDRAFLGEGRNKWNVEITNNTFLNSTASTLIRVFGGDLWDFGENASIDFSGNQVLNYGNTLAANTLFQLDYMDRDGWYILQDGSAWEEVHTADVSFCDNYITINRDAAATGHQFCVFHSQSTDLGSKAFTLRGNTIVGTKLCTTGSKWHYDFASSNALQDISGNLFLDYDNRIRAPRISTIKNQYAEYCVQSDIYASDEKVGGVKELFTVTESPEDLFVAHSMIQTVVEGNDTADLGYIRGTITVYPQDGVTYNAENLFAFADEEVELIGVYGSEADAAVGLNALTELEKGFGTAYAKAEYKAGSTTATVIYTVVEPTKFHVVAPAETTSYEFNGDTYTEENSVFYTTLTDAVAGSNDDWENRADLGSGIYNPPCSMKPQNAVILVAPGTYEGDITLDRAIAIIGPGFGKKASTEGAATVANGRGVDAATEAVYTGIVTMNVHGIMNDLYVAVSGMAFNGQDRIFVYDYSGKVQANNQKKARFAYLNLTDIYAAPKSGLLFQGGYKDGALQWVEHADDSTLLNVNIDNSYLTNFADTVSSNYIYGQMGDLNITDTTVNLDGTPACPLFKMIPCGKNLVVKPLRDHLRIENCYWKATANNYLMNYGPYNGSIKDTYGKGSLATIVNNTFETNSILYRAVPVGVKTQNLIFTGNTVKRSAASATAIFAYSLKYGATAADMEFATADISNNIIINSTSPWDLTASNSINVDENFYGADAGKALKISGGSGYTKSDWYYLDHELEVKNTDLMPLDNDYEVYKVEGFENGMNQLTIELADEMTKDDVVAGEGVTVDGIYEDAACENEITTVTTASTVYIKLSKVNSAEKTVSCVNEVELAVPCKHTGNRLEGDRVAPTCGTPGSQEYICEDCGEVVPAWTEELLATEEHVWDAGVVDDEPTCQTMGFTLYTCTNDDCKADGSKATKTEQDIPTVECESDGIWHEIEPAECDEPGTEVLKCKWCEEVLDTRAIDPTGHTPKDENTVYPGEEPSCGKPGRAHLDCAVCGETIEDNIVVDPLGGCVEGDVIEDEPGSCTQIGSGHTECINCGEIVRENVPIYVDHIPGDWERVMPGKEARMCTVCGTPLEFRTTLIPVGPSNPPSKPSFKDVKANNWYYNAVEFVAANNLFNGVGNGNFAPDNKMTRAMFVTVLGRLHGVQAANAKTQFTDVSSTAYYAGYVAWASKAGIVNGISATQFAPDANITREQICVMMVRYINYAKITLKTINKPINFADAAKISSFAKSAVAACQVGGIVNGRTGNVFDPHGTASRAEVATVLMNFCNTYLMA